MSDHVATLNDRFNGFNWKFIDNGRSDKDSFMRDGVLIHTNQPKINRNIPGWVKYMKI